MVAAFLLLLLSRNGSEGRSHTGTTPPVPKSAEVKTIAVLPFKMPNADPGDEYLGLGLADTLITQIGRIPAILARPPSAVQKYAESRAQDPLVAGRELRVQAILDGTVQREGDKLVLAARLLRVSDGALLWSGRFNEQFTQLFEVQDAISQQVAKALIQNLNAEDKKLLTKHHTDNPEAYRAYLRGRYFWNKRTPAGLEQSLDFFKQAIDLDPTYASAYAGLADAYALLVWQDQLPQKDFIGWAKGAATKALEIDETLAEPHATLGFVKFWYDWDFVGAESEFRQAIELNPDYATAHHWYGEFLGLTNRFDEGFKQLKIAQQIDPLSAIINTDMGKLLVLARQPDQAIEQLQKTLELDPKYPLAHLFLALAYNEKGLHDQAIAELQGYANAAGGRTIFKATLGFVYAQSGRKAEAISILNELKDRSTTNQYISAFQMALVYVGFGEKDKAIEWLDKAKSERDPFLIYVNVDPNFDSLRDDPRFTDLAGSLFGEQLPAIAPPSVPDKSIAVLPFENLSEEQTNAFFADGVQDELLTDLSRIADLKVISRASVMDYKSGAPRNLRDIGQELGVANVVEGSVQRSGNRVRVNAQLLDTRTGRNLWAQTYDRDLADVFAIESELATTIAEQLQAKLSPAETRAIERAPTTNITAFDLYTRAKELTSRLGSITGNERANDLNAVNLLNQAVAHDPSFFDAYCQLAQIHDGLYVLGYDHTSARLAMADAAVEAASRLRPDAGETHLARAQNLYQGYLDYAGALAELEAAHQSLPNDPRGFLWKGLIERRQGRWEESTRNLERAIERDPRNLFLLDQTAQSYQALRRYTEEQAIYQRIMALQASDPVTKVTNALIEFNSKADTQTPHQIIDSIRATTPAAVPSVADAWLLCSLAEHDSVTANNALAALGENPINLASVDNARFSHLFIEGVIARMTKNENKAQSAFAAARDEQEKVARAQANYGLPLCMLGLIDAALGRKQQALREGERAIELVPPQKDAVDGAAAIKYLGMIAAWVGDKDLAFQKLATAIHTPSGLSYGQLKLLPFWDPLRGDPRFSELLNEARKPVELK
jgi:TolB-like protein/Tfp pilus assembly protein PilF